jgi:hypothetical protein
VSAREPAIGEESGVPFWRCGVGSATHTRETVQQMGLRDAAEAALAGLLEGDATNTKEARQIGLAVLKRLRKPHKGNGGKVHEAGPGRSA